AHRAGVEGDPAAAERCLALALETDPLRETALRHLLELLTEQRRFTAARKRYEAFCRLLAQEGSLPERATDICFRRLREEAGRFEASPQAGAIPNPLSSFVPREEEIEQLQELVSGRVVSGQPDVHHSPLTTHHSRLVTLTGSGGVGKSRLSMEVA